jgi:peptidyl-prolyl cis-trans isomerase SurA
MINKLFSSLAAGLILASAAPAQTLFTYGTKPVSQSEFIRAFEKNPSPGNRQKAMKDYLPLFINYKLKVQDAIDKRMDTLPNQVAELKNYHDQLVDNYINTKANTNALVKEAFERSQKDILLGDLFIGFNPADSNSIKQAAQAAEKAKAALDAKQDFEAVVKQYSTDEGNKASGGRVGWITVFSVPYPFETIIYNLPSGGYSAPVKTGSGYHIFKKVAERPAAGTVKVAQIMLVNPDKANKANEERNRKLADSLYTALQNGASFDSLAYEFSNDRTSYDNGGMLPEFGIGTYAGIFEDAAFSLKNKGEISKPFATEFGWHILKLVDKKPFGTTIDDVELNTLITQKVKATGRSQAAKNAYLQSQMKALKYKAYPLNEKELFRFTDSSITTNNISGLPVTPKTPIFSLGKSLYTAADWLQFVKTMKFNPGGENRTYPELFQAFIMAETEDYVHKNIATIEPSFALQYKEFRDANLLFEAMDKNVWTKAASDTASLKNWYNMHKTNYKWKESAIAVLVTCTDSTIVEPVISSLKKDPSSWHKLSETYPSGFIADSGRYELNQLPGNTSHPAPGELTQAIKNDLDGSYSFASIYKILGTGEQRSFEDAKGFVINDYQQSLEEKWVASLKKKYPVKINEAVWKKLLSSQGSSTAK